jgi:hypothetical protein
MFQYQEFKIRGIEETANEKKDHFITDIDIKVGFITISKF